MTVSVQLESLEGLKHKITIEMPWDDIDTTVNQEVKKIRSKARIDGFRPGKVPEKVIVQRYGAAIRQDAMKEVIDKKLMDEFKERKLNVVQVSQVDLMQVEPSELFKFAAIFEVFPEINFKDLSGVAVRVLAASVEEKDIDNILVRLQNQYKEWVKVDRAAVLDDKLVIDFIGYRDGEPFAGGKAEGAELVLGSKQFIPGFEEGLVGVKAGETKTIQVTFPKEYHEASLAGAETTFDVTVHEVLEGRVRSLDAAFAELLGVKEGGIEALRVELKQGLERELASALREENKKRALTKLKEGNVFDVPEALVQEEMMRIARVLQEQAAKQKQKVNLNNIAPFAAQARDNIITGLLMREVVSHFNLKVEASHVRNLLEEKMSAYEDPTQMMQMYYNSKEMLEQIQSEAMEMLIVEALLSTAQKEEENVSAEEAIRGSHDHHHHDHDHDHDHHDHEH